MLAKILECIKITEYQVLKLHLFPAFSKLSLLNILAPDIPKSKTKSGNVFSEIDILQ